VAASLEPRILVTGAGGFLGRHLLESELREPVAVLVRDPKAWQSQPWAQSLREIELIEGRLEAPERWAAHPALREVEQVLHLAAYVSHSRSDAEHSYRTNVGGSLNAFDFAAQRQARMIFVSTSGTVGCFHSADEIAYEDAPDCEAIIQHWPYYASKLEAERRLRARAREHDIPLVIVRPPVLLGPRDHRLRSSGHVLRVLENRLPCRLPGGIAFVDVRDVASALARLLQLPAPRPLYHLPGFHWPLDRFFETIAELAGGRSLPSLRPSAPLLRRLARGLGALPRQWRDRLSLPDPVLLEMGSAFWGLGSHHAREDLAHAPRPARETLTDTLSWLRAEGHAH